MTTSASNLLSIVIPAKNERPLLPGLLESLCRQDYPLMRQVKVFVADAGSTDGTVEAVLSFADRLNVEVIPGGLPSVGRNAGARAADSEFVLFVDADMELKDTTLVRRTLELAQRRCLDCVTTNIWCSEGSFSDHLLYVGSNIAQYGSMLVKPFSTGMYMLFRREVFNRLGGFHEHALYAEDYLLSKKVRRSRFAVVRGRIHTTNRRFRKMGHAKIVGLFLKTALHTFNDSYFLRDQGYWQINS
jgi:glycosyltransferase involved in cell wall biosynthesis